MKFSTQLEIHSMKFSTEREMHSMKAAQLEYNLSNKHSFSSSLMLYQASIGLREHSR
jgi:hypothetical protein